MKYLYDYELFEKSSLTHLGVPNDVMVDIQKQFALPSDVKWKNIKYKKDLRTELRKYGKRIFISVSEDKYNIVVIFSVDGNFYVDNYKFYIADDMGDEYWDKEDRIKTNVTDINKSIQGGSKIYKLLSDDWTYENSAKRKMKKYSAEFDNFTLEFKKDFAKNFTKIVKRLYSNHSSHIQEIIIHNLISVNNNISPEDTKEILATNVSKAKQSDYFKKKGEEEDPYQLQVDYIRDNSITIFNEFLISFEDEISQKYNEFLNIHELCLRYGRDKISLSFMYFLYSGKIMKL
jgi:hypothetical protein